jgi:hypothetical protein
MAKNIQNKLKKGTNQNSSKFLYIGIGASAVAIQNVVSNNNEVVLEGLQIDEEVDDYNLKLTVKPLNDPAIVKGF